MRPRARSLWVVTPAWQRHAVTRLALAQRAHLSGELAAQGLDLHVVVVADDENLDLAEQWGFDALEAPNVLGRKVNDGIEHALHRGADYVTVIGSDDWIHSSMFSRLPSDTLPDPVITDDRPFVTWDPERTEAVCGRELAVVDLGSGRLCHCVGRGPAGVIPWVFPRRALEAVDGRPANDRVMKGLDGSMLATLGPHVEWVWHDPHPLARVDFKSSVNLNAYEQLRDAIGVSEETDAWQQLEQLYPAALVELARDTADQLAGAAA